MTHNPKAPEKSEDMVDREAALRSYLNRVRAVIDEHGVCVIGTATEEGSPFAYTVGNFLAGRPEFLFLAGVEFEIAKSVLNALSSVMGNRGSPLVDAEVVDIGAAMPVKVLSAPSETVGQYLKVAAAINNGQTAGIEVLQVVMPDVDGHFPGDPDCMEPYASQIILG